ncbi:MAG: MFS transporter [bacterium]|nr:MFS transporter [bacterium]
MFFSIFPAFRSRNYRLYFVGQFISMCGTWLQIVAQGWLVLELTHSPFLIGVVAACATLPMLLFSLIGGTIVDRFPKKNIIFCTQIAAMILAFILGILTIGGIIEVWEIAVLAFLLGTVGALDTPARQAFVIEMVGRESLPSAIALNSSIFNGARVIGPVIAGILIVLVGSGGAFIVNALSYIAAIVALYRINTKPFQARVHPHPLQSIKEGVVYALSHPIIRILLLFAAVTSIFGWSYMTMMPVIASDIFHLGPSGLGYLYAAGGLGAFAGSIFVSAFSRKISPRFLISGGSLLFLFFVTLFTFTSNPLVAFPLLFISGFGMLAQMSTINAVVQSSVEDGMRGRIMGLYALAFAGLSPLGNLEVGFLSERFGPVFAIRLGAVMIFLFGAFVFLNREKIRESQKRYLPYNT